MSIYEVHIGSWRKKSVAESFSYRELAGPLVDYVKQMGFTHVEFLPVAEHAFYPSWGYQVTGFYAPTSRYGTPDDFQFLVNALHEAGIGVIVDWVPGAFPARRLGAGQFRWHRAVRARRSAQRRPPGLGHADFQLRPA